MFSISSWTIYICRGIFTVLVAMDLFPVLFFVFSISGVYFFDISVSFLRNLNKFNRVHVFEHIFNGSSPSFPTNTEGWGLSVKRISCHLVSLYSNRKSDSLFNAGTRFHWMNLSTCIVLNQLFSCSRSFVFEHI